MKTIGENICFFPSLDFSFDVMELEDKDCTDGSADEGKDCTEEKDRIDGTSDVSSLKDSTENAPSEGSTNKASVDSSC